MFIEAYQIEIQVCQQFCALKFQEIEDRFRLSSIFEKIANVQGKRDVLIIYTEFTYIEAAYLKNMEESNL